MRTPVDALPVSTKRVLHVSISEEAVNRFLEHWNTRPKSPPISDAEFFGQVNRDCYDLFVATGVEFGRIWDIFGVWKENQPATFGGDSAMAVRHNWIWYSLDWEKPYPEILALPRPCEFHQVPRDFDLHLGTPFEARYSIGFNHADRLRVL